MAPTGIAENVKLLGESDRDPPIGIPAPLTVMMWGLPAALSASVIWSVLTPVEVGEKVIWMAQVPPAAGTVEPQLLVWLKFPVAVMLLISKGKLPGFMRATLCGLLVLLIAWLPKSICWGISATAGISIPLIFATKALLSEVVPANVAWEAPEMAGKFEEVVLPVI